MTTITIRECRGADSRTWTHRSRATDRDEAMSRAIRRHFGARAWFWADSGLHNYGQICKPAATGGNDCVTGRVRIDIE